MGKQAIRPNLAVVLLTALVVALAAFLVSVARDPHCSSASGFRPGRGVPSSWGWRSSSSALSPSAISRARHGSIDECG